MSNRRAHYATTTDGVTIGGSVHGQGPPLVFVHGIIGDGDLDWQALLPRLTDRFTCHLPSTRGRGLSGEHPDHMRGRLIDDIVTYIDSIGEPTGLVGFSSGGAISLAAAAQSDLVAGVAVYEPALTDLLDEQQRAGLGEAVARVGELAAAGELTAATRAFADFVCTDEEVSFLGDAGYLEAAGRCAPVMLDDILQAGQSDGVTAADPAVLSRISAPILLLHGLDTVNPWFTTCVHHVADQTPNARVHDIPGGGHYAPLTHPEALAEALTEFFVPVQKGA